MKTFIPLLTAILLIASCTPKAPDFDSLTSRNHPRLFADAREFKALKKKVNKGDNEPLTLMHAATMRLAEDHGLCPEPIIYKKDASNKRILSVSRETITRIFSAAYAYRFTGDERYLHHAENDINTVCDFKDWNPRHYLDCAEMATAVAIGYDWLYNELQDSTRAKAVAKIEEYAFETSLNPEYTDWYGKTNNWNQVCNAGLTCAALATYESHPEAARAIIDKAIETDRRAVEATYPPMGAYPEGPVYWGYGNMYQVLLLAELESTLGTDFGLGDIEGFSNTGKFECFTVGNTGQLFNYYDNLPKWIPAYPLWYIADRWKCPEILYSELKLLKSSPYTDIEGERMLPLYVIYASHIDPRSITPIADKHFISDCSTPVAMVRTGWDEEDLYLGIKGGHASSNHGHMDVGEFVYDAYGVRWASDIGRQEYAQVENQCMQLGTSFWDMGQNSVRWKLFRFNCRQHNTLTVNDRDHNVRGHAAMLEKYTDDNRLGASFDLTPLFDGALKSAVREGSIRDGEYLEIIDRLAGADTDAKVQWTLVGEGEPEITPEGIVLRAKGKSVLLSTEGADVNYELRSSDPADYGSPTAFFDFAVKEHICGFSLTVPAGGNITLKTTIKKL